MKWVVLVFTIAVASFLISFVLLRGKSARKEFQEVLTEADTFLSAGRYDFASDALKKALLKASNGQSYFEILKRVLSIAQEEESYVELEYFAQKALEKHPRKKEFILLASYSALRNGNTKRALKLIPDNPSAQFDYTILEIALRSDEKLPEKRMKLDRRVQRLLSMESIHNPMTFEDTGKEMGEPRLLLNAGLLWMERGQMSKARQIVTDHLIESQYDEFAAYVLYDVGAFDRVYEIITESDSLPAQMNADELTRLTADTLTRLGQTNDSFQYYLQQIRHNPRDSWIPYYNVAQYYMNDDDLSTALSYLQEAYAIFQSEWIVRLELARYLIANGKPVEAALLLEEMRTEQPQDYRPQLYLLEMEKDSLTAEEYVARMWQLFNEHPDEMRLCRPIVNYQLGFGELSASLEALRHYERVGDPSPWLLNMRGIIHALDSHLDLERLKYAASMIDQSLALEVDVKVLFNRAVVSLTMRDLASAYRFFQSAETELKKDQRIDRLSLSRIKSRFGEVLALQGKTDAATAVLRESLDLDPDNYRALLLLRQLESE